MIRAVCTVIALSFVVFIHGCTAKKVEMSFDEFQPATMKDADILPDRKEVTKLEKRSVVVFGYDNTNSELTEKSNIKEIVSSSLENYMANIGVELVSRQGEGSANFREEIKLYRLLSGETGIYNGPYKANYFIMGLVNAIGTKGRIQTIQNKRSCLYTANISGSIRVYNMLERKIVKDIRFDTEKNYINAANNTSCPITSDIIPLLKQAADGAMESSRGDLLNYFTSQAYVLEKRIKDDQSIFKISMGKNNNLQPGDQIHIYTKTISNNRLTNTTEAEERKIAKGRVTDFVNNAFAWVAVDDAEQATRVRFGDVVRVEHYQSAPERAIGKLKNVFR